MAEPAIRLCRLGVTLPGADHPVLTAVDLTIDESELVVVVGRTGSGKSTLLGAMCGRVPHFSGGTVHGGVLVHGRDTREHRPRDLADLVGVVGQDPLAGFVTDTVEEELAYGMEQLGLPASTMRTRVEETLDLLGIADLRGVPLRELSGGQQQRVAIGSVLTTHPRVILLDEPTSALDPTSAEDVLATVTRLVHDLALTVVIAEHRVERVLHHADRVVHIGVDGRVRTGAPAEMMLDSDIAPPVVHLGRELGWRPLPLSVRQARRAAGDLRDRLATRPSAPTAVPTGAVARLRGRGIVVRHPGQVHAVSGVDLDLHAGEVSALMGRNGSGKSSLLWALQGSGTLTSGTVLLVGSSDGVPVHPSDLTAAARRHRVGLVPQDAADLLYLDTVGGECIHADRESQAPSGTCAGLLEDLAPGIRHDRHPRDLSEGQRLALVLAVQLTADPPVLLLDEPTRGLDPTAKDALAETLRRLAACGRAVVVSSHDVEFVAISADRVIVLAGGEVVADGPTHEILTSSPAFAPQVAKVLAPQRWLTVTEVRHALAGYP
jgi:energy-coupling factor transport system ATP-binding protein